MKQAQDPPSRQSLTSDSAILAERMLEDLRQKCSSEAEFHETVRVLGSAQFHPESRPKAGYIGLVPVGRLCAGYPVAPQGFRIPRYQRGYRWRRNDVRLLLKDLSEFLDEANKQGHTTPRPFYCLQPLVVKEIGDGPWEVVDGQQRLTTLFLIFKHLNQSPPFQLDYATRQHSRRYLESLDGDPSDNIDFHHIFHAAAEIEQWFKENEYDELRFRDLLNNTTPEGRNVRFIWYQLRQEDDSVEVFTRLNVGKIPLSEEELIRALFLRNPQGGKLAESSFQHRLALEWDRIETRLRDSGFWGFLSTREGFESGRIRLLFELCAPQDFSLNDHSLFQHYEGLLSKAPPERLREVWQKILSCFELLEEWWNDSETFHLVGFLTTVLNQNPITEIKELLRISEDPSNTKSAFKRILRSRIRACLIGDHPKSISDYLDGLNYLEGKSILPIRQTLALFNIATLLKTRKVDFRFPFDVYHSNAWDIEHVSSQAGENLNRADDQDEWLELCKSELKPDLDAGDRNAGNLMEQIDHFRQKTSSQLSFEALRDKIQDYFEESGLHDGLHGIGNLTLLDAGTNRAYKNALFAVKRSTILGNEKKGTFILPCTRDLFLKVYSERPANLRRWKAEEDGSAHKDAICNVLEQFFGEKGASGHE